MKGALSAVLGAASPSVIIILIVAMVFNNITEYPVVQYVFDGIRPAVVALILYAVIKLAKSAKITEYFNWLLLRRLSPSRFLVCIPSSSSLLPHFTDSSSAEQL